MTHCVLIYFVDKMTINNVMFDHGKKTVRQFCGYPLVKVQLCVYSLILNALILTA